LYLDKIILYIFSSG